jgi:hypothetical protein
VLLGRIILEGHREIDQLRSGSNDANSLEAARETRSCAKEVSSITPHVMDSIITFIKS